MSEIQKLDPSCIDCKLLWDTLNEKHEIEEQLKCALEITKLGLWEWILDDNSLVLSDEIYGIVGFTKDEFDGTMDFIVEKLIHPDSKQDFLKSILKASVDGVISNKAYRITHPKKNICWIQLYSKLILDSSGNPLKVIGSLIDITNKIDSSSAILKSLTFLETLIETLPNPIFYKDRDGVYRYCNSLFIEVIGKTKSEIIGHTVHDIADKTLADIYHTADLKLMEEQGVQEYEAPVKYSDGSIHDIVFRKAVHVDENNEAVGLVGIMEDITEKKLIKKELDMFHKTKDIFISINRDILIYQNEKDFFDGIQDRLQSVFEYCDQSTVLEVTETNKLLMLTNRGYNSSEANDFSLNLEDSFVWEYTSGDLRNVRIINDIEKYIDRGFKAAPTTTSMEPIRSTLMLPLYFENKLKWLLSFDSVENNIFTKADILLARYICEELPILYRVFNLYQQSKRLSIYDALTGFMNFNSFKTALDEAIEISYNYNEDFSVALFELTELLTIGEKFGHDIGDNYLLRFSRILKAHFFESDMMYRTGVNKFAVIFIDADKESLSEQIESIKLEFELTNLNNNLEYISHNFKFDISIYTNDDNEKLLELSDIKLDVD